ncbi:hypothetical protein Nepgr_009540 [Nepenthes gracilis]|uniref:Uncharacterized protein n=1 Tax=Nepenthes gracilis TaxID=150966 RepID=A0AAD3SAS3_NEPGR|nr:hypothetical protein Nepgr_009540 [Nepenthes gracilis]
MFRCLGCTTLPDIGIGDPTDLGWMISQKLTKISRESSSLKMVVITGPSQLEGLLPPPLPPFPVVPPALLPALPPTLLP